MNTYSNPPGLHKPAGAYSHVVTVPPHARWLVLSGQIGVRPDGSVAPGIAAQTSQTYANILTCLEANGMSLQDVVKFTVYLTDKTFIGAFFEERAKVFGAHNRPASTLLIVDGLMYPDWCIEIDCTAAKA
ncbi:MAG: RidA family protein [Alphaproteobacteria bacterium]